MQPYWQYNGDKIYHGNALDVLRQLPNESVNCCVTSPPYWGLRDYGVDGQLGLEQTPEEYVSKIVEIFQEVKRVLRGDGTVWLNLGDSYTNNSIPGGGDPTIGKRNIGNSQYKPTIINGVKPKNLVGIPWRVAFALQADGWYLRSAMPWIKRNGMPESTKDRPVIQIDQIFLLSKSRKYFYNYKAVMKIADGDTHARYARGRSNDHKWSDGGPGNQSLAKSMDHMKRPGVNPKAEQSPKGCKQNESFSAACKDVVDMRMRRNSDWFLESLQGLLSDENGVPLAMVVNTAGFSAAHFATFPEKMVKPCILAGCPKDGAVLDPFFGSGTTGVVAHKHDRKFIGIELSEIYLKDIAIPRIERETRQLKLFTN